MRQFIEEYERAIKEVEDNLVKAIQPVLNAACEKWGLYFSAGMGSWDIRFERDTVLYDCVCSEQIFEFLEPELCEVLNIELEHRYTIGSILNPTGCDRSKHEWVFIETLVVRNKKQEWYLKKRKILKRLKESVSKDYEHYGPISRTLAEYILKSENCKSLLRKLPNAKVE